MEAVLLSSPLPRRGRASLPISLSLTCPGPLPHDIFPALLLPEIRATLLAKCFTSSNPVDFSSTFPWPTKPELSLLSY